MAGKKLTPEMQSLMKEVRLGKASKEVQLYLQQWLVAKSKALWRRLIMVRKPKLEDFLEIQAEAKTIDQLDRELIQKEFRGKAAAKELSPILNK